MKGKTYSIMHFLSNLIKNMSQGIVRRLSQQKEPASEYEDLKLATRTHMVGGENKLLQVDL